MDDKILLLGKHVIITEGDFKGVTGLLKSVEIISDTTSSTNSKNGLMFSFKYNREIECKIIINEKNIITVPIDVISKLA